MAKNRSIAEDASDLVEIDYEEIDAQLDMESALNKNVSVIHNDIGNNLFWTRTVNQGDVEKGFKDAYKVEEVSLDFARHTGVTLESRSIIADWDTSENKMTIYHNGQAPHMMQHIIAKHFNISEGLVRVISCDVGGSFGIKVHVYPDEIAAIAISKIMERPIKFVADRLESYSSDIHLSLIHI